MRGESRFVLVHEMLDREPIDVLLEAYEALMS